MTMNVASLFSVLLMVSLMQLAQSKQYTEYYLVFNNPDIAAGECPGPTQAIRDYLYIPYVDELITKTPLKAAEAVTIDSTLPQDPLFVQSFPQYKNNTQVRVRRHLRGDGGNEKKRNLKTCTVMCENPTRYRVPIMMKDCECDRRRLENPDSSRVGDVTKESTRHLLTDLLVFTGNSSYIHTGPGQKTAALWYSFVQNNVTDVDNCRNQMYNATYEVWEYIDIL